MMDIWPSTERNSRTVAMTTNKSVENTFLRPTNIWNIFMICSIVRLFTSTEKTKSGNAVNKKGKNVLQILYSKSSHLILVREYREKVYPFIKSEMKLYDF